MRKLWSVMLWVVCLLSGWGQTEKVKIAILRIEDRLGMGVDTDALTESFQIEVVNRRYFLVVERSQLNKILEEQKLKLSGLTEEEQATQIGNLLGAQKIWVGSLARFGEKYMITMKSIDSKTGVIDFADQVYSYDVEGLLDILPDLAGRMIRKARGENVANYVSPKKPQNVSSVQTSRKSSDFSSWDDLRPDEAFDIGFYRVRLSTNANISPGGALSLMIKSPADRVSEFYLELRFYAGDIETNWSVSGVNFNLGLMFNPLANGYVLLGGGIGIGFDMPAFGHKTKEYSVSCFEWTIPLSLQFGLHLGRSFMLVAEVSIIPGFGLSVSENTYPSVGEPGKYITISDEKYYVPSELETYLKNGMSYAYTGLRLSFLF